MYAVSLEKKKASWLARLVVLSALVGLLIGLVETNADRLRLSGATLLLLLARDRVSDVCNQLFVQVRVARREVVAPVGPCLVHIQMEEVVLPEGNFHCLVADFHGACRDPDRSDLADLENEAV